MRELTYAEACVLGGAQAAYLAAREVGLGDVTAAIQELCRAHVLDPNVLDDAISCVVVYSYGDVPRIQFEHHDPDFDIGPVSTLADHVDDEGLYEGRRTGVCVVAARVTELAEQRAEFGDAVESPEHQRQLDVLAGLLSDRFQIARDAPPRFNHPAGVS